MQACFRSLRAARNDLEASDSSLEKMSTYSLHIISRNNFPTAAGLASSAAGFAALVRAVANLYQLRMDPTQLSEIARQGSGSACRSLFGGYVAWEMGSDPAGKDSVATQVATRAHWPDMRALILVASARQKDVSSTSGMQLTVATSPAMAARIKDVVPGRMLAMRKAIHDRDFGTFADLSMRDSNNFHATCLDTHPPIFYMNDSSRAAVRLVDALNAVAVAEGKGLVAAYTFDAGPNAVVYYLAENEGQVAGVMKTVLADKKGWTSTRGQKVEPRPVPDGVKKVADGMQDAVVDVILTAVDDGPIVTDEHLTG